MKPDLEKLFDQAVWLTGTEREEFIGPAVAPFPGANAFLPLKIFCLVVSVFSPLSASRKRILCAARFGLGGLTP
jgi:hypothetical protein